MSEWLDQRRRRAELNKRYAAFGDCAACGHPWAEHAGTNNEMNGMCGECAYEFEHGQRTTEAPGCVLPCPESP